MFDKFFKKLKLYIKSKKKKKVSINENDIFLYQSSKIYELFNPKLIKIISTTLILILFSFIGLASITHINEAAIAKGEIEPQGNIIDIQHFDGGIVTKIHVYEGDSVKKGEILLSLDGIGAREDLARYKAKNLTLKLQAERLESVIKNTIPNFRKYISDEKHIQKQKDIFNDMLAATKSEKNVIRQQLSQQEYLLQSQLSKRKHYKDEIEVVKQILSMYEKLYENKYTSKKQLLEEKRRLIKLERDYNAADYEIKKIKETIQEYKSRLLSYDANYLNELNQQYEKIDDAIKENNEVIKKLKQKAKRLSLESPVAGLIKSSNVHSIGEVIHPSKKLFEIVPFTTPLIAVLEISPNDIGHVKVGDLARIKVSAFDYIKYGIVEGRIYHISASTFSDEEGNAYYKGKVKLSKNYLIVKSQKKYLMPGMIIKAEIITGERTILEYLLKPIFRSVDSGLTER